MLLKELFKDTTSFQSVVSLFGIPEERIKEMKQQWDALLKKHGKELLEDTSAYLDKPMEEFPKELSEKLYSIFSRIDTFAFHVFGEMELRNESEIWYISNAVHEKYRDMVETMPTPIKKILSRMAREETIKMQLEGKTN